MGEIWLAEGSLLKACDGDPDLAGEVLDALDAITDPVPFLMWVDSPEWTDGGVVYRYDRRRAEIAAAIGKACVRSSGKESFRKSAQ